jgi:hypothetical protein
LQASSRVAKRLRRNYSPPHGLQQLQQSVHACLPSMTNDKPTTKDSAYA